MPATASDPPATAGAVPRCGGCGGHDFSSSFAYVGVAGSGYIVHCASCGRAIGFVPAVLSRIEQEIMEQIERQINA